MTAEKPNEISLTDDFEFAALREAVNYRAALVAEFAPWLRGSVVEVGAGIGQISSSLAALPAVREVVAIEPEARFCREFRRLHPQMKLVEGILDDLDPAQVCDAILCVNVLEHIRDDDRELAKFHQRLAARRGHLCLFVPARQEIYAPLDKDFGHYRRYDRAGLREKLELAGFQIIRLNYFNFAGYFAWWLNFCVRKQRKFEAGAVRFYDRAIFPLGHWLESRLTRPPIGQSLIAMARAGLGKG
jgi:SAM-dependent methyltransferase